jgi:DNA-binding NtrC family response regulator
MNEPVVSVLLVDDEPMILSALSRLLRNHGYRVLTTTMPTEVAGILEKEKVEVLLSDIDMPKMKGTVLMAQIRSRFPEVVRILMTGRGSMDSVIQAINEGEVYRYLLKPFKEEELLSVLREATSRLKELRRASAVAVIVARRNEICAALELQYPGLSQVNRQEGIYYIPAEHLDALAAKMGNTKLNGLLKRRL